MAALEAVSLSVLSYLSSSSSSSSFRFLASPKPSPSVKLRVSYSPPSLSLNFPFSLPPPNKPTRNPCFVLCTSLQEAATEDGATSEEVQSEQPFLKRKLFVVNFPWSLTVADIKTLFAECGTVDDVEIIRQKNGKSRGFAFVTMATGEEAQTVVEKFDSREVLGRIIRVDFAKKLKPSPPQPASGGPAPTGEPRHKLYVSNLPWKARSADLKEFFSPDFKPSSARVIFENPTGRSAGYGFVSFATKEEAEAAISAMNGKPLMDRPLQLKLADTDVSKSKEQDETDESEPIES